MRKVRCYECGKSYDFDMDDFCPKCGAFNQPKKNIRIAADGAVVRAEGLNEKNHAGSFVHQEFHAENRMRKAVGLSKGVKQAAQSAVRPQPDRKTTVAWQSGGKKEMSPFAIVKWVILFIVGVNILSSILGMLFW